MSYSESSNTCRMAKPLMHDHGNYKESTLSDDNGNSKPPDGVSKLTESLCINNSDAQQQSPKKSLGEQLTSFVLTKWRFLFLAMIASVSLGWYLS